MEVLGKAIIKKCHKCGNIGKHGNFVKPDETQTRLIAYAVNNKTAEIHNVICPTCSVACHAEKVSAR